MYYVTDKKIFLSGFIFKNKIEDLNVPEQSEGDFLIFKKTFFEVL